MFMVEQGELDRIEGQLTKLQIAVSVTLPDFLDTFGIRAFHKGRNRLRVWPAGFHGIQPLDLLQAQNALAPPLAAAIDHVGEIVS